MELSRIEKLAELKLKIGEMEAEAKEIQAEALQELRDTGKDEMIAEGLGKIVLATKAKWTYPVDITEAETKLKADKKGAEQLGTATNNPTFYTRWLPEGDKEVAE